MSNEKLIQAGIAAVRIAKEFWLMDIIDPKHDDTSEKGKRSRKFIDSIIRTDKGLNWSWERPYIGDADFAWCGAFVGACWRAAGLKPELIEKCFASTYRLDRYARSPDGKQVTMYAEKVREYSKCENLAAIESFAPRQGDILLIGGESGYGHQITLIVEFDPSTHVFRTIEGNSWGEGPDHKNREGVMRAVRNYSQGRRLIRPSVEDLI